VNTFFKMMIFIVVLAVFALSWHGAQSAVSSVPNPVAQYPWTIETVISDIQTDSIAVAYGGSDHYPLITYVNSGGYTRLIMPAISREGNCGSGNRWYCWYKDQDFAPWSASPMAVYHFQNSFKIGWVFYNKFTNKSFYARKSTGITWNIWEPRLTQVLDPKIYNESTEKLGIDRAFLL